MNARSSAGSEPAFLPWSAVTLDGALARLPHGASGGRPRLIAVDGRSGAGKTTLAGRLANALPGAVVVHTDDVAWHHTFFDWHAPLIEYVLEPCRAGRAVSWRPEPWIERGRPGAIVVPEGCSCLIVEGAGASREELSPYLDARVWVASDPAIARAREIARDGDAPETLAFIEEWSESERAFFAAREPWATADLIVCGTPLTSVPEGQLLVGTRLNAPDRLPS